MDNYYVILDTNVLVSGLLSKSCDSPTFKCIDLFLNRKIILITGPILLQEYKLVLSRKKFSFDKNDIEYLLQYLKKFSIFISAKSLDNYNFDINDKHVYELFNSFVDENFYLVTGNIKDFPKNDHIVTPRSFIELIKC